jgi:hypothetical protein
MDAATLYTIIALTSGQHPTNTLEFQTMAQCSVAAKELASREPLISKTQIYCVKHKRRV